MQNQKKELELKLLEQEESNSFDKIKREFDIHKKEYDNIIHKQSREIDELKDKLIRQMEDADY